MSNFSDFLNQNKDNTSIDVKRKSGPVDEKNLEQKIEEYSKFSKDELMSEFIKMTIQKKKQGELSSKDLENIKSTILPYLNGEQKENMENLLKIVEHV